MSLLFYLLTHEYTISIYPLQSKNFLIELKKQPMQHLQQSRQSRSSKGFTLIELLTVIAIISILSSVVMTSLNTTRTKALDSKLTSQVKAVGKALELTYQDSYPPCLYPSYTVKPDGEWCVAWIALQSTLSPYLSPSIWTDSSFTPIVYMRGTPDSYLFVVVKNSSYICKTGVNVESADPNGYFTLLPICNF